jgi:hypothetical protein
VTTKITLHMRPTGLAANGIEMVVAVPAVRDHDPRVAGPAKRVELVAVAVLGDLQEHRIRGGRGPQRAPLTARAPASLIDMLVQHDVLQMQVRGGQRLGCALADRVRGPGAERDAEQITRELRDHATRDPIRRGNATIAACNRDPNGDPVTEAGSGALVRARQCRQRN